MKRKWLLQSLLLTALFWLAMWATGCISIVLPSHANAIQDSAGNAVAMNRIVQADTQVPQYVKTWMALDTFDWQYMADWSHGRHPDPLPPTTEPGR